MKSIVCVVALVALWPLSAQAWWNEEWTGRKPIRIDTSAAGASITDPIGSAPVLLRLHAGNYKFELAKEDGSDLRFVAGDDRTPLPFQIEKYDSLLGEALAWVLVPDLKPGTKTEIWLYYRNPKAVPAEAAKDVFERQGITAYHFAEKGSIAGSDGALIGRGAVFDGTATFTAKEAGAKGTWSAWIKPAGDGAIFSRDKFTAGLDSGKPFLQLGDARAAAESALVAGSWHHFAVELGESLQLFVDGAPVAKLAGAVAAGPLVVGDKFKGEFDELQIAGAGRPAGFLKFAAISQGTDPGKLIAFGQDEENAGWSGGYFTIIIKSVTLDGWVVIGLLGIMMAVSWLVMITKAQFLGRVHRANERFRQRYAAVSGDLVGAVAGRTTLQEEKASSLYHLWRVGAGEVAKRSDGTQPLSAEAIESIRASLDAALVRENQRLNERMVLLTIAISGGPFLGLLGTVVGVMITFASIAAAGDVNVNAIAPGIAAALVATVAGLAVAIPSLFGYNWLLTRAKNVTANQQVFADELVTQLAEAYSEGNIFTAALPRKAAS
ncbi:MAG TPA: DUF2341 domain-containing protein [Myxococcales bacterium]|nr:DUF2341 domain-containing protein [Myxococcales bacterium]